HKARIYLERMRESRKTGKLPELLSRFSLFAVNLDSLICVPDVGCLLLLLTAQLSSLSSYFQIYADFHSSIAGCSYAYVRHGKYLWSGSKFKKMCSRRDPASAL